MKWTSKLLFINLFTGLTVILLLGCQQSKKESAGDKEMNGMDMSPIVGGDTASLNLSSLLKPTNEFVISSIPAITTKSYEVSPVVSAIGSIAYDTRQTGVISSWATGRIEKLYLTYRYQKISIGQKVMDVYSPELLTNEENLLFLLKNDPANVSLINAAKERLRLLGMSTGQIQTVVRSGKPINAITTYSNYDGHILEPEMDNDGMNSSFAKMNNASSTTEPLSIKQGMYVQKGQKIFSVYNTGKAWILLNIYVNSEGEIQVGNPVRIVCETAPEKYFTGKIDFIEPFYRQDSKTVTARVYFNNSVLHLPIGSQVTATITANKRKIEMLPSNAVVSLGINRIVFKKVNGGFKVWKVEVGNTYGDRVQIFSGLSTGDSVAANAQFLMDSESFIKVNE